MKSKNAVKIFGVAVVALALVMGLHLSATSADNNGAAPQILGKTYGEWSAAWWQWALIEPTATNPVAQPDPQGVYAVLNQKGPVWFLAGTFSPVGITRNVQIPQGKYILFPIVNVIETPASPPVFYDVQAAREDASKNYIDPFGSNLPNAADGYPLFECTLDGKPVVFNPNTPIVRSQSPVFKLHLTEGNFFGAPAGNYSPSVSDGYWVMLPPLSPGQHNLHYIAKTVTPGAGPFSQELTYILTVKPDKH